MVPISSFKSLDCNSSVIFIWARKVTQHKDLYESYTGLRLSVIHGL